MALQAICLVWVSVFPGFTLAFHLADNTIQHSLNNCCSSCHSSHVCQQCFCELAYPLQDAFCTYLRCDCADLNDLANADGDMDEHKDDPMSHMNIEAYVVQQLRSLHSSDRAGFEGLCTALNATQLQTIKSMLG